MKIVDNETEAVAEKLEESTTLSRTGSDPGNAPTKEVEAEEGSVRSGEPGSKHNTNNI